MNKNNFDKKISVLEEKLNAAKEATILQAKEYERRLEALNGEAERLREMQTKYLPRETWDIAYRELVNKLESLQKLVYIGLGIAITLQLLFKFII